MESSTGCVDRSVGHLMRREGSRIDVQPITWELPAAGALCWLVLAALLLPAGQGTASWLFGGEFVWPHVSLLHSLGGLLTGHPGLGLATKDVAHLASGPLIYLLVALAELALFMAASWATVLWWRHLGPGAMQGMAGPGEVERVLGLSNLRKRRKVIRPDLFDTGGAGRRS
jgi:type IV secretion system protein VirD4